MDLGEAVDACMEVHADRWLVGERVRDESGELGEYAFRTYGEVRRQMGALSAGLWREGVRIGDVCLLWGASSVEWHVAHWTLLRMGVTVVPLHYAAGEATVRHVLAVAKVGVAIVSRQLVDKFLRMAGDDVRVVVEIEDPEEAYQLQSDSPETGLKSLPPAVLRPVQSLRYLIATHSTLLALLIRLLTPHHPSIPPTHLSILVPTSGTTGQPKLIIFPASTLLSTMRESRQAELCLYAPEPLRQSVDIIAQGGRIGVWCGRRDKALEDLALLRPTYFASTPHFFSGLRTRYLIDVARETDRALAADPTSDPCKARSRAERDISATWLARQILGNRCRLITVGGAPSPPALISWIWDATGAVVHDGYGATECGGITREGSLHPGAKIKLIDVPGYTTRDRPYARGEILVSTSRVSGAGYYGDEAASAAAFVQLDGQRWFKTGDIGEMRGGKVRVIDRRASVVKVAQGVFVAPEELEGVYTGCEMVSQCFVWCGEGMESVAAVVVPSERAVEVAKRTGKGVEEVTREGIRECWVKAGLKAWELPVKLIIEEEPFTVENGLLSSLGKMCRPALQRKYRSALEETSEGLEAAPSLAPLKSQTAQSGNLDRGLREVLDAILPGRTFRKTDSVAHLGVDSMRLAVLSAALTDRFGVELPLPRLARFRTLIDLQTALFSGDPSPNMVIGHVNWSHEVDDAVAHVTQLVQTAPSTVGTDVKPWQPGVLLTGCTGFLGSHLLHQLLANPHFATSMIYCLARDTAAVPTHWRVVALRGDVSKPLMGLEAGDYAKLMRCVTAVVHSAAVVNGVLGYEQLRETNVNGTARAVALAIASSGKAAYHHVSSMSVFTSARADDTDASPAPPSNTASGYASSKWVAESLVDRFRPRLRGWTFRFGALGPPASDFAGGMAVNDRDATIMLVRGLKALGCYAADLVPDAVVLASVDWAAKGCVAVCATDGAGAVVDVEGDAALNFAGVMRACGVEKVHIEELLRRLEAVDVGHPLFVMRSVMKAGGFRMRGITGRKGRMVRGGAKGVENQVEMVFGERPVVGIEDLARKVVGSKT
ncbi:Carboxylic acid reductase [Irineochytrium annulatum]|nr:Carboxylic acid reductase [Irineochytrium annulatum]